MNNKALKLIYYVTLFFSLCVANLSIKAEVPDEGVIPKLIEKLGASKFRERKDAIKELIKWGYYARSAIQDSLKSTDPEIRENAQQVWQEIENIITPHNSQEISTFIQKLKDNQAQKDDWLKIVDTLQKDSLNVMIKIFEKVNFLPREQRLAQNLNAKHDKLNPRIIIKTLIQSFSPKDLQDMASQLSKENKKALLKVIESSISAYSPYEQASLLKVVYKLSPPEQLWTTLKGIDFYSPTVLGAINHNWLNYLKK